MKLIIRDILITIFFGFCIHTIPAQATLVSSGSGLINDTDLNVTWVSDANLFHTLANNYSGGPSAYTQNIINAVGGKVYDTPNIWDTPANSGVYNLSMSDFDASTGLMNWWGAQAWISYLNQTNYGGYSDWILPTIDPGRPLYLGALHTYFSDMNHLFYEELGGVIGTDIATTHNENYNLFANIQSHGYWFGNEYTHPQYTYEPNLAWVFNTFDEDTYGDVKYNIEYILPVRLGQASNSPITPVPTPHILWLFSSGFIAILCFYKKQYSN